MAHRSPGVLPLVVVLGLFATTALTAQSTLTIGTGEGSPGDPVSIAITLDTDDELRGFSFGVAHDDAEVVLDDILSGADVSATNSDAGADYLETNIDPAGGPGGYVACIIDLELAEVLPIADGQEIILFEYTVATGAVEGTADLTFSADLGDPPVSVAVVPLTVAVSPTTVDGSIEVLAGDPPHEYTFRTAAVEAIEGGYRATLSIEEGADNVGYPNDTTGFTMQIAHDFDDTAATAVGAALGAEFVDVVTETGGAAISVLYALDESATAAFGTEDDVLEVELTGGVPDCTPGETVSVLTFSDAIVAGSPNTVEDGTSPIILAFEDGTFDCPPEFIRGDIDGNGALVGLVDAIRLLAATFVAGEDPVSCDKAADVNDDGLVEAIVDTLALLAYAYEGGAAPPDPGPSTCGPDPTGDDLDCDLVPEGCL